MGRAFADKQIASGGPQHVEPFFLGSSASGVVSYLDISRYQWIDVFFAVCGYQARFVVQQRIHRNERCPYIKGNLVDHRRPEMALRVHMPIVFDLTTRVVNQRTCALSRQHVAR
jgi:hypothetical protein